MDVIIAIGHDGARDSFADEVRSVIARLGSVNAIIAGPSWSPGWGSEDATWFAATFETFPAYAEARSRILAIGAVNGQDAVAFTTGTTEVPPCPKHVRRARDYRDFL